MGVTSAVHPLTATLIVESSTPLEYGGHLDRLAIGFRHYGDPGLPLVIALGGISAGRHIVACPDDPQPGWWEAFVGDGLAIDTTKFSVLGMDWLGGSGASTGPGRRIDDRRDVDTRFPAIGTRDQATALIAVLDHLGIAQAHAIIGASYGGMVALSCSAHFPDRIARSIVISAAHRTHPMATALRSLQRGVVRLGLDTGRTAEGLRLARGIAMTTYRTIEEFAERFDAAAEWSSDGPHFPVEAYLGHTGRRFAERFSAESFLCLSESIDLHQVDPARVKTPTTLIAVDGDTLVPPWQMKALHDGLSVEASWNVVASIYGHDAFLKEVTAVSTIIADALD
jgi:homoserine O-acetyltransferase